MKDILLLLGFTKILFISIHFSIIFLANLKNHLHKNFYLMNEFAEIN